MNYCKLLLFSSMMICLFSSCGDDFDFESHYPGGDIKTSYEETWKKEFGEIDPNQDWCMAQKASVTVSVAKESNIQIFASNGLLYSLVGDFEGLTGAQTLEFDIIKGQNDIYVSDGENGFFARSGDVVSFGAETRAGVFNNYSNGIKVEKNIDETKYFYYDDSFINNSDNNGILDVLPDNVNNIGVCSSEDFSYVATTGEVIVYPVLWAQWDASESGIYYMNNQGNIVRIPLYRTKTQGTTVNSNLADEVLYYSVDNGKTWKGCTGTTKQINQWNGDSSTKNSSVPNNRENPQNNTIRYMSTGIVVTIPQGTKFGFYLHNLTKSGTYFYSQKSDNSNGKSSIGTLNVQGKTIVGIEDTYSASNMDFNDVMFVVDNVVTISNTVSKWYIACEDMGDWNSGDYDFNDLVFEIEHKATRGNDGSSAYKTKVTPCAAGGTLEAWYSLDGGLTYPYEIHQKFGEAKQSDGKYKMINTNAEKKGLNGYSKPLPDPDEMTANVKSLEDIINTLKVKVVQNNGTEKGDYVLEPSIGTAPQMIVAPQGWIWPREQDDIRDAYGGFAQWSKDATVNDWYRNANPEMLYTNK